MFTKEQREEMIKKAMETKANNLKQSATLEERETHILIDYYAQKIKIYTNNATVMNRMERKGYSFTHNVTVSGETYSRSYEFDITQLGDFLRVSLFG